ncbi:MULTISPECIES: type II secretion system F family protein [Streptomyces]|uniref:Type II secretion system (T2SS), protein F n=1 Tax=Streptomyces harbinensis TaxID=1176198 RepID=A0A1I6TD58_9ACTN|nr:MULTISPECIES: type II secretion system F family protein [Streptomyces]SFS87129.1 Type II secretion system (T2SS), protein F [Streptomyces harbinensis]
MTTHALRVLLPLLTLSAAVAGPLLLLHRFTRRRTTAARLTALTPGATGPPDPDPTPHPGPGAVAEAAGRRARLRARIRSAGAARTDREDPQLPLIAELLAACLAAGAAPAVAAGAVGGSLGGPLGDGLRRAATELRLGGEPAAVWKRFGQLPGAAGLARRLELAGSSGAPAVAAVAAEAVECRGRRRRAAQTTARRAAVLVTGPLGLCFLPAYLLIGVAPVVIGLAKELM